MKKKISHERAHQRKTFSPRPRELTDRIVHTLDQTRQGLGLGKRTWLLVEAGAAAVAVAAVTEAIGVATLAVGAAAGYGTYRLLKKGLPGSLKTGKRPERQIQAAA